MTKNVSSLSTLLTRRGFRLMGTLVLALAILFPPRSLFYRLLIDSLNLKGIYPFLMQYYPMLGGLLGQAVNLIRLIGNNSPEASNFRLEFVASCLATLSLTLCTMFFWRLIVDRAPSPTVLRVLSATLSAVGSSLVLTLLLCLFEVGAAEFIFNTIDQVIGSIIIMVILLIAHIPFIPILFAGGTLLTKRQARAAKQTAPQAG